MLWILQSTSSDSFTLVWSVLTSQYSCNCVFYTNIRAVKYSQITTVLFFSSCCLCHFGNRLVKFCEYYCKIRKKKISFGNFGLVPPLPPPTTPRNYDTLATALSLPIVIPPRQKFQTFPPRGPVQTFNQIPERGYDNGPIYLYFATSQNLLLNVFTIFQRSDIQLTFILSLLF